MDDPTSITESSSLNDLDYIDDGHDDYFNAGITAEFNDYFDRYVNDYYNDYFNTWFELNNVNTDTY